MTAMMGAELLLRCLAQEDIHAVFGIPGDQLNPFTDAIARLGPELGVHFYMTRHEQAAAHMADAYARVSGKPAVCVGTVGPGAVDLVPGVYPAWADSIPMVVIAAQNQTWRSYPDHGSSQGLEQIPLFTPITKWRALVNSRSRIPELVHAAFRAALSGKPGPVYLEVPSDVMVATAEEDAPPDAPERYRALTPPAADACLVEAAARLLVAAERPLLHAGGGVLRSGAWAELLALAEYLQAPCTTSIAGRSVIPEDHPLCLIPSGYGALGAQAVADTVLLVGGRLGDLDFWGRPPAWGEPGAQKWIQVDVCPESIGLNHPVDLALVGDARQVLKQLLEAVRQLTEQRKGPPPYFQEALAAQETWLAGFQEGACSDAVPIHPLRLMREVRSFFPREAICAVDGGNTVVWAHYQNRVYSPRSYLQAADSGHLGVGLPYAIGAQIAAPDRLVYLITGDGSFMFNVQELESAVRLGTPVIVVIANDTQWGMIKGGQKLVYDQRYIGVDFNDVRFDHVAQAMGCYAERVTRPAEIRPALERAVAVRRPAVLDVMVDREANLEPPDLCILDGLWMEGCEVG